MENGVFNSDNNKNSVSSKIDMIVNQHISDKETAEHANNDLIQKLQRRGLGGAFR